MAQPEPFPCPECGDELKPKAKTCDCGWKAPRSRGRKAVTDRDVHAEVADILNEHRRRHRRWPRMMPQAMPDAVQWFIDLLEPADPKWERAREMPRRYAEGSYWEFPYIDRVTYCLHVYLSRTAEYQDLIMAAREDGVYWRGDPYMDHFIRNVHETMRMSAEIREKYIPGAIRRMKQMAHRGFIKRMPGTEGIRPTDQAVSKSAREGDEYAEA